MYVTWNMERRWLWRLRCQWLVMVKQGWPCWTDQRLKIHDMIDNGVLSILFTYSSDKICKHHILLGGAVITANGGDLLPFGICVQIVRQIFFSKMSCEISKLNIYTIFSWQSCRFHWLHFVFVQVFDVKIKMDFIVLRLSTLSEKKKKHITSIFNYNKLVTSHRSIAEIFIVVNVGGWILLEFMPNYYNQRNFGKLFEIVVKYFNFEKISL